MFSPNRFPASFRRSQIGGFHDAGATAGCDHKALALLIDRLRPLGDQECQPAGVFVVPGHLDIGFGATDTRLLFRGSEFGRTWLIQQLQGFFRLRAAMKTSRAKKNNSVLNAFPPETRQRLQVFRLNP